MASPTHFPCPHDTLPDCLCVSQNLDSFPGGQLYGSSPHRTLFDPADRRWGGALTCNAAAASFAALQPPTGFGQQGGVAISVWIKLPATLQQPGDSGSSTNRLSGEIQADSGSGGGGSDAAGGYGYVLSLTQAGTTGSSSTNQVSILILVLLDHDEAVSSGRPTTSVGISKWLCLLSTGSSATFTAVVLSLSRHPLSAPMRCA